MAYEGNLLELGPEAWDDSELIALWDAQVETYKNSKTKSKGKKKTEKKAELAPPPQGRHHAQSSVMRSVETPTPTIAEVSPGQTKTTKLKKKKAPSTQLHTPALAMPSPPASQPFPQAPQTFPQASQPFAQSFAQPYTSYPQSFTPYSQVASTPHFHQPPPHPMYPNYFPSTPCPSYLPGPQSARGDDAALSELLLAWYWSGYHTGKYQARRGEQ